MTTNIIRTGRGVLVGAATATGRNLGRLGGLGLTLGLLGCVPGLWAATVSPKIPVVPKWERFEHEFRSLADYENPVQDVTLQVLFVSPLGETTQVYGFWDGGRSWRVRFAPNQPGRWRFKSTCSDGANLGLNDQTGEFLCTSSLGKSSFYQHGPVRLASDRRHLEHADRTPFFWLADTVWTGASLSDPKSWDIYSVVRSSQNFNVAQWALVPGTDFEGQSALTGFPEKIGINPEFFRRLDAKISTSTEVGMLAAIAPLLETKSQSEAVALPDDQAALLVRYAVARWGADPVAWVLPLTGEAKNTQRWKKIGQQVFQGMKQRAPVMITGSPEILAEFKDQDWVDLAGVEPSDRTPGALKGLVSQANQASSNASPCAFIVVTPQENGTGTEANTRVSAEQVRASAFCGWLETGAAGITYAGYGVANWNTSVEPKAEDKLGAGLPFWHKALFMPAAKQVGHLATLGTDLTFWELRPEPKLVASAGDASANGTVFAAATPSKSLALVYSQKNRQLELSLDEIPQRPSVTWYNPRRGDNLPAVAVATTQTCQFPTPDAEDWLLIIRAGK